MDAANSIVQGGQLIKIIAGGLEVGWARSSSFTQDYGTEAVYAIGSIGPIEHDPLRWSATITLDEFVIHRSKMGQAIQLMNLAPMGPDGALQAGLIDFQILDATDTVIMVYENCTIQSYNYTVTANAFSGQNATFLAMNVREGAHPQMGLAGSGVTNQ